MTTTTFNSEKNLLVQETELSKNKKKNKTIKMLKYKCAIFGAYKVYYN